MHLEMASPATGNLPRLVRPDLLWAGSCLDTEYRERVVHGHFSCYCLKGSEKTVLIDTGHPVHWRAIEPGIDNFLDGRPLDYIFVTHAEFPHGGLIENWMRKYPSAVAAGDLRGYSLFYPDLACRFLTVKAGDKLDLGDRDFIFVPAIWRDINNTLWGFETGGRTLFVADAFSYLHLHEANQCDFVTSEHSPPDADMIMFFNERALYWTRAMDAAVTFEDMDDLLQILKPRVIAGAHGAPVDTIGEMVPVMKQGMRVKSPPPPVSVIHPHVHPGHLQKRSAGL